MNRLNIMNIMNIKKSTQLLIVFLLALVLSLSYCNDSLKNSPKDPIKEKSSYKDMKFYQSSPSKIYKGSIYYNQAACSNCHGVSFNGKGPQSSGLKIPSFTEKILPSKTPLDYFLAITTTNPKFPEHKYLNYTDRGRWAMTHFLYSLSKPLKTTSEKEERQKAIHKSENLAKKVYSQYRNWYNYTQGISDHPRKKQEKLPKGTQK